MNVQPDPFVGAVIAAASSISIGFTVVAQSAVNDGLDPTTGWAGGIIVGGVGVFLFFFRYWSKLEKLHNEERRAAAEEMTKTKDDRISNLEAEIRDLREKYEALLRGDPR